MAAEEGLLDRNPCTGITVRVSEVAQQVLTATEVKVFLESAANCNHRFYPVWVMALMTDIDFEGRTISVSRAWNSKCGITPTKTRRSRVVPIADELIVFLKEQKLQSDSSSEFVLPRLEEWEHGEQARVTREFCEGIGITSVKFHDLRATFITNLLASGESLARVMSIVGHSELKTTNGYLRKAGVDVKGGTDKLSYGLPKPMAGQVLNFSERVK